MNDAGRIGFVIRDDYDNTVQYDFLDVVYYHGNSYVAKKLTLGNIPNENNEYWHILAAGGVRVKGDAETEYRDGDVNITKENIGLGETENKSSETIRGEITSENITNALDYTPTNTKVKGNAETEYRTGEVNLTPENIGLGNVNNTSDADKPISTAQQEEFNKKVNKTDIMQGATSTAAGKAGLVPTPLAGDEKRNLTASGKFEDNGIFRNAKTLNTPGWYRVFKINSGNNTGGYITPFILNFGKTFTNTQDESGSIICSGSGNVVNWRTLSRVVRLHKNIDKVRISSKNGIYVEIHYLDTTVNNVGVSFWGMTAIDQTQSKGWNLVDFEPAESDETVISEYVIPNKDDFDTSKSLTRFEEIPSGADLKSDKYLVPGNYICPSAAISNTLINSPITNSMFTMVVGLPGGQGSNTTYQHFYPEVETFNIKRTFNPSGMICEARYYASVGTPPANKLWGTDANGNVGWIDPP